MSDDLVKRLRDPSLGSPRWMDTIEAADRIAELEAEVKMWRNEDKKKQTACEQMGNRIAKLEAALKDMAKYIWRDDYQKLEPTTRAALGDKK